LVELAPGNVGKPGGREEIKEREGSEECLHELLYPEYARVCQWKHEKQAIQYSGNDGMRS
jgi:hypothetical protein